MNYRRMLLVLGLCAFVARSGWAQDPPFNPKPDEPQPKSIAEGTAHFKLRETDRGDGNSIVSSLWSSERLRQEAVRATVKDVLKEVPAELPHVTISSSSWMTVATITVRSFDQRIPAERVLEKYVDLIRSEWFKLEAPNELMQQANETRQAAERLRADLTMERSTLVALAKHHGVDLNPDVAAQKQLQVETERQRLIVEREGLTARQVVLQEQIQQAATKAEEAAAAKTPIVEELLKSIEARKKVLEYRQAQFNAGAVDSSVESVERAKDELAKAQLELARHRQSMASTAGKDRIDLLQSRLDDTVVELAENQARSAALDKLAASLAYSPQVESQRRAVEIKEQELDAAEREVAELRSQLKHYRPPQITLIRTN